jgi:hypothetical protein
LPLLLGPDNNSSSPILGVVRGFLDGLVTGPVTDRAIGLTYLVERIVLVAVMAAALWLLARRASRVSLAEASAAVVAIIVAATLRNWSTDVQFLRAGMEAWGLSVLVLIISPSRRAQWVLYAAGLTTLGVSALYVIRV